MATASATKKSSKKASDKKGDKPEKAAAPKEGVSKKGFEQLTLSLDQITMPKNKSLIVRESNGDISTLVASIKKNQQIQNLVVRPSSSAGKFELLCGHRRFAALREAGKKIAHVVVRTDVENDMDALGLVMSENSGDVRTQLTAMEQGAVYERMAKDKEIGDNNTEIGKRCSVSRELVRMYRELLSVPAPIKKMLEEESLSAAAAVQFNKIADPAARKATLDALNNGDLESPTRREIERFANEIIREQKNEAADKAEKGGKKNKKPEKTGSAKEAATAQSLSWRTKAEIKDEYNETLVSYTGVYESKDKADQGLAAGLYIRLGMLLWCMGVIADTDFDTKACKRAIAEDAANCAVKIAKGEESVDVDEDESVDEEVDED